MTLIPLKHGPLRARLAALVLALFSLLTALPAPAADTFDLGRYAGKVVVLDFWASWCEPCRRSFPWLNAMHDKYGREGLVIVGVNLDMERADAQRFLDEYPADFSIVYDADQALARQYEVVAMPSSYVIGRDGQLAAKHMGFKVKQQDEYEALIVRALRAAESDNE
ncbi:MAG TPA: TlpA disulfide reductase family protein [Woeseiaceae bacterium]|nr:TlpA disulfide reductase family protein [Woeseiaceae bacterium]